MRKITFISVLLCTNLISAQSSWKKLNPENTALKTTELAFTKYKPDKYKLYSLDLNNFESQLLLQKKGGSKKTIMLPGNNGFVSEFFIQEISNFTEPVASEYGFITSYSIQDTKDKTSTGKMSIGSDGIHITVYSGNQPTFYIDPYTKDNTTYIGYSKSDLNKKDAQFECLTKENIPEKQLKSSNSSGNANDGKLRTFRLALSCTGEYAKFHINHQGVSSGTDAEKKAAVLSAMNTTITRINGIFERDLAVRMNIVLTNGTNPLIFLDPDKDNLTNGNISSLFSENQILCDTQIGTDNYDIGHIFFTSDRDNGAAIYLSACSSSAKGKGATGTNIPTGDAFVINLVIHEIGHQFGAVHTYNGNSSSCGSNRTDEDAVEPGSGSTIMAYAGLCGSQNVQNDSDDYFHAISIESMWDTIQRYATCGAETDTGNTAPTANAGPDYTVPKLTPLLLKGSGSDVDGSGSLTYCWEQIDNEIVSNPPLSTNTGGPLFRSFLPVSSPNRYLPSLYAVSTSLTSIWEVLPGVGREMNFSLTVRDNHPGGGATARDDMKITVINIDPFSVTAPAVSVNWSGLTNQTITWNKSTTDQTPINCENVRIKLSADGGVTFPHVLAESTPNDGSEQISVPNIKTTQARIMVEAVGNIFFDVNPVNFTIVSNSTASLEDFSFTNFKLYPNPSNGIFTLTFDVLNADSATIKLYDLRGRLIENKRYKNIANRFSEELNFNELNKGLYILQIQNGNKQTSRKISIK